MTAPRRINLTLPHCNLDAIEGSGNELTVKLRAQRTTKGGITEFYNLELKVCRYGVKQLLDKLREMHVRDLERIESERARVERERNALVVKA